MASSFFALFDDIATLMQDVATMSKVATKKAAGIIGDDLAVNAERASGFISERELPVIWAITKGSFLNKLIILPIIFLLSAFLPWSIAPLLLLGGAFLAYEGAEKIFDYLFHKDEAKNRTKKKQININNFEKQKIKSAIFIDFILSIEIILIALSAVENEKLKVQIFAVTITAIIATIGVYGIVALLVRMDDFGLSLINKNKKGVLHYFGIFLVRSMPVIIKSLTVIGTIAMLLVAGGIYIHHFDFLHHLFEKWPMIIGEFVIGLVLGIFVLSFIFVIQRFILFIKKK